MEQSVRELIITELGGFIEPKLVVELLDEYQEIRKCSVKNNPREIGIACGLYIETALKILLNLKFGEKATHKGVDFDKCITRLINEPKKTTEDEIICHVIPLVLKAGYTLRNKKRIAHARGIEPVEIDSNYFVNLANWVLAELLRAYHTKDEKEIEAVIGKIIINRLPIIQDINGEKVILKKSLPATSAIMAMLYLAKGAQSQEEIELTLEKYYKKANIKVSLNRCIKERKVHIDKLGNLHLTEIGHAFIQKSLM